MQPYVEQGRLGVEREVKKNLSLSATYLYYHGLHLTHMRDINHFAPTPFPVVGPDGVTYTFQRFSSARPISRAVGQSYNRISIFESAARSVYNGLAIQALALGYDVTGDTRYREAAEKAAGFVLKSMRREGKLVLIDLFNPG